MMEETLFSSTPLPPLNCFARSLPSAFKAAAQRFKVLHTGKAAELRVRPFGRVNCFARVKPFGRARPRKGHMCIRLVRKSSTPYHREQCSVT